MLRNIFTVLALVGLLASAGAQMAQAESPQAESSRDDLDMRKTEELARQGLSKLIEALQSLIDTIPQYDKPAITEDGDIIIRRRKKDEQAPPPSPSLDSDET
jgi:hypothetical protein